MCSCAWCGALRGAAVIGKDSEGTVWASDPGWFWDELLSPRRCRQISPSSTLRESPYNTAGLGGVGGDGLRNRIGVSDCYPRKKKEAGGELVECVADIKSAVLTLEIMRNYYAEIVQKRKEVERIAFTSKNLKCPYVRRPQPRLSSHSQRLNHRRTRTSLE